VRPARATDAREGHTLLAQIILTEDFAPAELIEPRLSLGIPHDVSRLTESGIIWTEDKLITIISRVSGAPQEGQTRTGIILVRILQVLHK
jgi:hypothetical protein